MISLLFYRISSQWTNCELRNAVKVGELKSYVDGSPKNLTRQIIRVVHSILKSNYAKTDRQLFYFFIEIRSYPWEIVNNNHAWQQLHNLIYSTRNWQLICIVPTLILSRYPGRNAFKGSHVLELELICNFNRLGVPITLVSSLFKHVIYVYIPWFNLWWMGCYFSYFR